MNWGFRLLGVWVIVRELQPWLSINAPFMTGQIPEIIIPLLGIAAGILLLLGK